MSGDELAKSTGQHKNQEDNIPATEHDTSIDECGIKKKHRIRDGFSAFKKKLFPRSKSPATTTAASISDSIASSRSTSHRRSVDEFSPRATACSSSTTAAAAPSTTDPAATRMYKSTGDVLLEEREDSEIARSELSQSADSIYPIPSNNGKQSFEAASSLDEIDLNSELGQRLHSDENKSSSKMPKDDPFDSLFNDTHCPLDSSAARQRISIRPQRRKPTNKRLTTINNTKDIPPVLPKRPVLVPKAEISRKIHGLDSHDLSPTTRPPRNRPPSASEWPAMSLPTRVATPTTDTCDSDDSDSDFIQPTPPQHSPVDSTFKPIAAVRTTSPLIKAAVELPTARKPASTSINTTSTTTTAPTPTATTPTTTTASAAKLKTLPQPVPLKINRGKSSSHSKSPPLRTIDCIPSPPEDTPLHHQQKNEFADFFSKMKTPEEERTSVDLFAPKVSKNDLNKDRQFELNDALMNRSTAAGTSLHVVDRNRRQTVPLSSPVGDNKSSTSVKRAVSHGGSRSTAATQGESNKLDTSLQLPPPKPLLKHVEIDSHGVLEKPAAVVTAKPMDKPVKQISPPTVDKKPTTGPSTKYSQPAKILSPVTSPIKKPAGKSTADQNADQSANKVPEWAALAKKKTSKFEGNTALNRSFSKESPVTSPTLNNNNSSQVSNTSASPKTTSESITARFSMFENGSTLSANSKPVDSKPTLPKKFPSPVHNDPLPKPMALRKIPARDQTPSESKQANVVKPILKSVGSANTGSMKSSFASPVEGKPLSTSSNKTFKEPNTSPTHSVEFSAGVKSPTSPTRSFASTAPKKFNNKESAENFVKSNPIESNQHRKFTQRPSAVASRFTQNTSSGNSGTTEPFKDTTASIPSVNLRKNLAENKMKRTNEIINDHTNKRKSRVLDIVRNIQNPQVADA